MGYVIYCDGSRGGLQFGTRGTMQLFSKSLGGELYLRYQYKVLIRKLMIVMVEISGWYWRNDARSSTRWHEVGDIMLKSIDTKDKENDQFHFISFPFPKL